jgi:ribulose 1,5-bisphosphate synthetase/thiazole synthase
MWLNPATMQSPINRRAWLRLLGLSGLGVGAGQAVRGQSDVPTSGDGTGFTSSVIHPRLNEFTGDNATLIDGKVIQPRRQVAVLAETDVLVVGGGPAGVAAALAARRVGMRVTLVERYGHLGGLWTGGLVLLIIGHIIKGGKQVCQGIGEEMMQRLEKLPGGIINRRPGVNPTVDAEAVKYLMVEMIHEAKVDIFLHCLGVEAIVDGQAVQGVVFESKSGRQAVLAKVVVDATGDGDVFASAGAAFEHRSHNIGLVTRVGNLDRVDKSKTAGQPRPRRLGGATPAKGVNWVNMLGPEVDGLDVATLTRMEMNHRRFIWRNLQTTRQLPGYDPLYLVETAPQLGVRITRILHGLNRVRLEDLKKGTRFSDVIGVGGADDGSHGGWQIPYGALVPEKVDNVLAAGRCIDCEIQMADLVRLIPNCFVTGQAAGVAAAVSVAEQCLPRAVPIEKVQRILRQQKAYLGV